MENKFISYYKETQGLSNVFYVINNSTHNTFSALVLILYNRECVQFDALQTVCNRLGGIFRSSEGM